MEQYNFRKLDGLGRIPIHRAVRRKLAIETDSKLLATRVDTIVVLQRVDGHTASEDAICAVDSLGMITLPKEIRQTLGWNDNDEIALYQTDNVIILKSA